MLVLTRKRSEMIQIGNDVVIKVIQTGRNTVKIGIEAPNHVRVLRSELCELPVEAPSNEPQPTGMTLADHLRLRGGLHRQAALPATVAAVH